MASPSINASYACFECGTRCEEIVEVTQIKSTVSEENHRKKTKAVDVVEKIKKLVCSRCLNATYCSKECQKKAWPSHKTVCHQPMAMTIELVKNTLLTLLQKDIISLSDFEGHYLMLWLRAHEKEIVQRDSRYELATPPIMVDRSLVNQSGHGIANQLKNKDTWIVDVSVLEKINEKDVVIRQAGYHALYVFNKA